MISVWAQLYGKKINMHTVRSHQLSSLIFYHYFPWEFEPYSKVNKHKHRMDKVTICHISSSSSTSISTPYVYRTRDSRKTQSRNKWFSKWKTTINPTRKWEKDEQSALNWLRVFKHIKLHATNSIWFFFILLLSDFQRIWTLYSCSVRKTHDANVKNRKTEKKTTDQT